MSPPVRFYVNGTEISTLACVTSWDGIMSEGPIRGDVIEQDWLPGAIWQQGPAKVYSFEVPIAFRPSNVVNPELYDAVVALDTIKTWRGPLLALERWLPVSSTILRRQTASGILVSDLNPRVQAGRFATVTLVFQNTSGVWSTVV